VAAIRAVDVSIDLAALHAPSAVNGAEDAAWWATTQQLLAMSVDSSRLLLGIDANGKVGAVSSPSIGLEGGQEDDPNGAALRVLCDAFYMFLPQTFQEGAVAGLGSLLVVPTTVWIILPSLKVGPTAPGRPRWSIGRSVLSTATSLITGRSWRLLPTPSLLQRSALPLVPPDL